MFGFRAEIGLQIAYGIAAIRQEYDLLIHLQALRFQHLVKPALRLGVVRVDERKYLRTALGLDALAGNNFKPAFSPRLLIRRMHIAAVQADRQGRSRRRLLRPILGTAFDELEPFVTQFTLDAFGNAV